MDVVSARNKRGSALGVIIRWWRNWSVTDSRLAEPPSCDADRTMPLYEDMGLSDADFGAVANLRALARRGPDEATLLPRRMAVLGLEPEEVARLEPRVFRTLYWRCTSCESQGRCAWDLADDFPVSAPPDRAHDWQDYCPNAETLVALGETPWFRPATDASAP